MSTTLRKYFWVILLGLITLSTHGKNTPAKSKSLDQIPIAPTLLQPQLQGLTIANELAFLLDTLGTINYQNDTLAVQCAERAFYLAQEIGDEIMEAQSRFWLADTKFNQSIYTNNLEVLLAHTDIAATIFQKQKEDLWLVKSWSLMAEISNAIKEANPYHGKGYQVEKVQNLNARKYLQQAFDLYNAKNLNQKHPTLEGYLLLNKGVIFYKSWQDSAGVNWTTAEQIFKKENDFLGLARVHLNKAMIPKNKNASIHFEKAINLYQQINNPSALKRAYLRYGTFCIQQFQKNQQSDWWKKGIENLEKGLHLMGDNNICDALNRLGQAYARKDDFPKANYYFGEAIYNAKKENNTYCLWKYIEDMKYTCINTIKCDSLSGELTTAYNNIISAREGVVTKAVTEKETYQQEVKTKEAKQRQNQILGIGLGLFGLLSLGFFLISQRLKIQKLKSQTEAQDAKIQALSTRMNPHFISNTLNAIDSMIYTNDKAEASKYLVQFAKLSRLVLANSESTLISLEKEKEMLDYYLSLEKMRFEDEINFNLQIDDELELDKIHLPPMLLQPFIENAIIHGIQPKDDGGNINISIKSNSQNQLECIIEDDGIGRAQANAIQQQSSVNKKSYSTKIAEDRIQLINKIDGASLVTKDLHNTFGEPSGTKTIITIPKNLNKNE